MCSPTLWPLSSSTCGYSPIVYFCSAAMRVSLFMAWKPPAACQVEPAVSSSRSSSSDVGAAAQREVVQDAAADDAAADHDDLIPILHATALLSRGDGCDGVYPGRSSAR